MLHMLHMLILFFPARQRQRHKLRNIKDFRKVANPTHNPEVGEIATLMGNSPDICRRHYAALIPEAMHDVVEFGITSLQPGGNPPANYGPIGRIEVQEPPRLRLAR